MHKLTDTEGKALLGAAKRVHAYKLMQAKGYARLARKAQDERIKRLLMDVSAGEAEDAEHWANALMHLLNEHGQSFPEAERCMQSTGLPCTELLLATPFASQPPAHRESQRVVQFE